MTSLFSQPIQESNSSCPPELDRIERDFYAFHLANPKVYEALLELALRLRRQGRRHYGIKALYEVMRFEQAMSGRSGATWQLNNDWTCLYARLLMQNEPELRGFFKTRQRRTPRFVRRVSTASVNHADH